jgi:hypothetical protein
VHGDLVEVIGSLTDKDVVLRRGSDEIRQGTRISVRATPPEKKQK